MADTWIKVAWPFIEMHRIWGWPGLPVPDSAAGLYGGHVAELRSFLARGGPAGMEIPWAALSQEEQRIVRSLVPRLPFLAKEVVAHLDVLLTHYVVLWTDKDRITLLDARLRLFGLADWDPPTEYPPERENYEIYHGVDLSLRGIEALETLVTWVQVHSPEGKRPPPPTSRISDL